MNISDMMEVKFVSPDKGFQIVRETLTRIGITKSKDLTLYQICFVLHKRGRYYICHHNELNLLDGKDVEFSEDDKAKRNLIARLLVEWNLISVVNTELIPVAKMKQIKIVSHVSSIEQCWDLVPLYTIGGTKIIGDLHHDADGNRRLEDSDGSGQRKAIIPNRIPKRKTNW